MLRTSYEILRETWSAFSRDRAPVLAAALAYYTIFSLAPLLVIAVSLAGIFLAPQAARGDVSATLEDFVGPTAAGAIEDLVLRGSHEPANGLATAVGFAMLLFGASSVFGHMKDTFNMMWGIDDRPMRFVVRLVRVRILSFLLVLGVGALLLVLVLASAVLSALARRADLFLPGGHFMWELGNAVLSLVVISALVAAIFRFVPDRHPDWKDVRAGAIFTAALFVLGRSALGMYLSRGVFQSTYGAAASVAIVLIWLYYSALILFFGAEFTAACGRRGGRRERVQS